MILKKNSEAWKLAVKFSKRKGCNYKPVSLSDDGKFVTVQSLIRGNTWQLSSLDLKLIGAIEMINNTAWRYTPSWLTAIMSERERTINNHPESKIVYRDADDEKLPDFQQIIESPVGSFQICSKRQKIIG